MSEGKMRFLRKHRHLAALVGAGMIGGASFGIVGPGTANAPRAGAAASPVGVWTYADTFFAGDVGTMTINADGTATVTWTASGGFPPGAFLNGGWVTSGSEIAVNVPFSNTSSIVWVGKVTKKQIKGGVGRGTCLSPGPGCGPFSFTATRS